MTYLLYVLVGDISEGEPCTEFEDVSYSSNGKPHDALDKLGTFQCADCLMPLLSRMHTRKLFGVCAFFVKPDTGRNHNRKRVPRQLGKRIEHFDD